MIEMVDKKHWVEVELHSTEPSAVEATRETLESLPGGVRFLEEDGRYYVTAGFGAFAAERQGYVRRVLR